MYQKPEISLDFRNTKNTFIRYSKLNDQKCSQREFINSSNDTSIRIQCIFEICCIYKWIFSHVTGTHAVSYEQCICNLDGRYSSTQVVASIIYSELKTELKSVLINDSSLFIALQQLSTDLHINGSSQLSQLDYGAYLDGLLYRHTLFNTACQRFLQ
ncbi:Hypothetical_protein [Hexamita inflata]|uniref:Hypothetical_protein n=1 Tax=Hexamita inflata TaxID=28002 RepID=A0AA86NZF2_9EUKA|nr:Hypothetical protein HINF_LOCUS15249 [Hexamita inflata]